MANGLTNQQKSTINPFVLLTDSQWRFITAMIENPEFSKADGARHVGLKPNTVYTWGDHVDEALELARGDIQEAALQARKAVLLKAIRVKAKGLDSKNERVAQLVATEIIEWELGKATQRSEHSGPDGGALTVRVVYDDAPPLAGEGDAE